jgi:hypothetical protein
MSFRRASSLDRLGMRRLSMRMKFFGHLPKEELHPELDEG